MPDLFVATLFFVVPLGVLVAYSFGEQDTYTYDITITGTLDRYGEVFGTTYATTFGRSLILGAITAAACLLIAFPTAWALTRIRGRARVIALFAVMFPFVVSFTIRTYAWLGILRSGGPVADLTTARRCCCSTSPSPPSMHTCAMRCRSSFDDSNVRRAVPSSW